MERKTLKMIKELPAPALRQACLLQGAPGRIARNEYCERLVSRCVDDLLGYHEAGWYSCSPMAGAMEYQGAMPQDIRRSGCDRMLNEAMKAQWRSEGFDVLIKTIPARQCIAMLVNDLRERTELTQEEACQAEHWEILTAQLQLSRFFTPARLKMMSVKNMRDNCHLGKNKLLQVMLGPVAEAA
ncbi:hypothetical protein [Oceanospirillum sediminis]|uniref:Uncharacterized protein n=1 Tax=Oceanospirillum sediminis TaxID=2760088 RepID=A0A839IN21_9GAMM|nr:hypothetical protein [Oceanospirillum sediminis]MBB1485899.1 hypothetical protein [Oceanospirillum sediminis]